MEIFALTLRQMLVLFLFILIGFILRKIGVFSERAYVPVARLATYVFMPGMIVNTLMNDCTPQAFRENAALVLYGLVLTVAAIAVAYPVSSLFVSGKTPDSAQRYRRNIYRYALAFGNYGFMGNCIVLGIWGQDTFFRYTMFTLFVYVFSYAWGTFILIPGAETDGVGKRIVTSLIKPPLLATLVGIVLGLCGVRRYVPGVVLTVLSNASDCLGPTAMLLAGIVIGGYPVKELLRDKSVYAMTALRLVVIPGLMATVLKLTGAGNFVVSMALIAFATPMGLNTVIYPAAFGGDTRPGASMAMVSHTLSVLSIPTMYWLFTVVWK